MLAVLVTLLIPVYLIIPNAILRFIFGKFVPLRSFVRTKLEELNEALIVLGITLLLVWWLTWAVPPFNRHPFAVDDNYQLRRNDYKIVANGISDELARRSYGQQFWKALTRSARRQGRLLSWYYGAVVAEGLLFGYMAASYGSLRKHRIYRLFADPFLLPNISEWYPLLTTFIFEDKRTAIRADILCGDILYSGTISEHFVDKDGALSGVILTNPSRYDRRQYLRDKDEGKTADKASYWHPIPSAKLYLFAREISNLNLNYESAKPSSEVVTKYLYRFLPANMKIKVEIGTGPKPAKVGEHSGIDTAQKAD